MLGKEPGVELIHDLARIYNAAAIAGFKGNGDAVDIGEDLLKGRVRNVNDLLDFIIRIAIKIIGVILFAFAVDKVVEIDIEENILVFAVEHTFLELIKITEFENVVIISIPICNGALLIAGGILEQYHISNQI